MTPPQSKISEALLAYARPLLELLPDRAGPDELTPALQIATLVWNAVVFEELGRGGPYLEQARSLVESSSSGTERDLILAVLADMEDRKRREYPPDSRLIGEFKFIEDGTGALRLRVTAHADDSATKGRH